MTTDWLPWANFGLNLLMVPLVKLLLNLNTSVTELKVQASFRGEQIADIKSAVVELRQQVAVATLAASSAAAAAAAAAASSGGGYGRRLNPRDDEGL